MLPSLDAFRANNGERARMFLGPGMRANTEMSSTLARRIGRPQGRGNTVLADNRKFRRLDLRTNHRQGPP